MTITQYQTQLTTMAQPLSFFSSYFIQNLNSELIEYQEYQSFQENLLNTITLSYTIRNQSSHYQTTTLWISYANIKQKQLRRPKQIITPTTHMNTDFPHMEEY